MRLAAARVSLVLVLAGGLVFAYDRGRAQAPAPATPTPAPGPTSPDPTSPDPTSPDPTAPGEAAAEPARSAADVERRAHVVARIGEVTITVGRVEDEIAALSPFARRPYRDPAELRAFAENLLRYELLAREAGRRGLGDDPDVREATNEAAVQQFVRREFDERITVQSIPEADIVRHFEAHPEEFTRPEFRRASQVVFATEAEARAFREEARNLDAGRFRQAAQERSIDEETKLRGGDLRYFDAEGRATNSTESTIPASVARAAFTLTDVGDVSEPVEAGGRWAVLKLTGRQPAQDHSLDEMRTTIRTRLWRVARQEALDHAVEVLRARIPVEVHYELMAPIVMDPPERLTADPHRARPAEPEGEPAEQAATPAP